MPPLPKSLSREPSSSIWAIAHVVSRDYIEPMAQVGIRAFKAELSRYLRQVRSGRSVLLTDRGQVIAEVSAPTVATKSTGARKLGRDARLAALIERGVLRPAACRDRPWAKGRLVRLPPGTARRLLDADRAD
jgi:antitoxin (DNA-binding transcriptional repressor) of toxin-antitoxin stability system